MALKQYLDGVDSVNIKTVFGGMPFFAVKNMLEKTHRFGFGLPGGEPLDNLLTLKRGSAFTINDGNVCHRVVLSDEDMTFDPAQNLDVGSELEFGTDYFIYAYAPTSGDVKLVVSKNETFPTGVSFTADNTRKIGGFHYGTVRCVSSDGLMVPVDSDGTKFGVSGTTNWKNNVIDGLVIHNSVWDLTDTQGGKIHMEKGMARVGNIWVQIYLPSVLETPTFLKGGGSPLKNGKLQSVYGASPATRSQTGLSGYNFIEMAERQGMRLLSYAEWCKGAYGNPQGEDGSNEYGWTNKNNLMETYTGCKVSTSDGKHNETGVKPYAVSAYNLVDCVGNTEEWLSDFAQKGGTDSYSWTDPWSNPMNPTSEVGKLYMDYSVSLTQFLAGGKYSDGASCGARALNLSSYPWNPNSSSCSRFCRDAL